MALGSTIFTRSVPVTPPSGVILVRKGDDLVVPFAVKDTNGAATSLVGATLGCTAYDRFGASYVGAIDRTNDAIGLGNAVLSQTITSSLTTQTVASGAPFGSLSVWMVDSTGKRHTFDPIGLTALQPADFTDVAVQPALQNLIIAGTQGPAGPTGVTSVNGHTGASITLTAADLGAATPSSALVQALIFG